MSGRKLSQTITGKTWLKQFSEADLASATEFLDALVLMGLDQVSGSILDLLNDLAQERKGQRRTVGLYAEREISQSQVFKVESIPDNDQRLRRRAVGRSGLKAVDPVRGSERVGSEGMIAFTISQAVKAWPNVYANQPGPDRIRAKRRPISALAVVTDFIGSGARVCKMLDKFWKVASIKSWSSRKLIKFFVIAAAGTSQGIDVVRRHRTHPTVFCATVAPTINTYHNVTKRNSWLEVIERYNPSTGIAVDQQRFSATGALIAFGYGMPNNVPLLLREPSYSWKPLYVGPAPTELADLFSIGDPRRRLEVIAAAIGVQLLPNFSLENVQLALSLRAAGKRWHEGSELALAETTGFKVSEILIYRRKAISLGLLDKAGRLTDAGHRLEDSATKRRSDAKVLETNAALYYPRSLRIPRS